MQGLRKRNTAMTWKRVWRATSKRRFKKPYVRVIQAHHITYDPVWVVRVYKGEHFICTQLQRRTHVSKGFVQALEYWLAHNRNRAIDLGEFKGETEYEESKAKAARERKQKKVVDRAKPES